MPMRIGICAYPLSKGTETGRGLERVVEEFCNHLSRSGVAFDFYHSGVIRSELKAVLLSYRYLLSLWRTRNECYFAIYAVSGIFPALLRKRPLVTLITDMIPYHVTDYDNKLKYAIKRWCIKYSCQRSDVLIVGSTSIKNEIVKRFSLNPAKVAVVPWGLNHDTYFPDPNVPKIRNRISFLGEAKRAKGIDSIIKAFKFVMKEVPDATLSLASNGSELEEMKKLAADELPSGSYRFEGFIAEGKMNDFYNSSDLFIFPSRYGFGLSALEAMATGTPTLVGNTLDATDFFHDQDLLVNPDDERQIADKIIRILRDPALKAEKSRQALELVKNFSWERMSGQYLEVCVNAKNREK